MGWSGGACDSTGWWVGVKVHVTVLEGGLEWRCVRA